MERLHIFASYDLLFIDGISRPGDSIVYEDDGDFTPDLFTRPLETNMLIQGLSVGTIFEF